MNIKLTPENVKLINNDIKNANTRKYLFRIQFLDDPSYIETLEIIKTEYKMNAVFMLFGSKDNTKLYQEHRYIPINTTVNIMKCEIINADHKLPIKLRQQQ